MTGLLSEQIEREVTDLVEKILEETQTKIVKGEISKIIEEILPDIDRLVSNKVRRHFVEIAEFIKEKFDS